MFVLMLTKQDNPSGVPGPKLGWGQSHDSIAARTPVENAIKQLGNPGTPPRGRQGDPFLTELRSKLLRKELGANDPNQRVHEYCIFSNNDFRYGMHH